MLHSWCWDFPFFEDVGLGERAVAADGATLVVVDAAAATTEGTNRRKFPRRRKKKGRSQSGREVKSELGLKNFERVTQFFYYFFQMRALWWFFLRVDKIGSPLVVYSKSEGKSPCRV